MHCVPLWHAQVPPHPSLPQVPGVQAGAQHTPPKQVVPAAQLQVPPQPSLAQLPGAQLGVQHTPPTQRAPPEHTHAPPQPSFPHVPGAQLGVHGHSPWLPPQPSGPQGLVLGTQQVSSARHTAPVAHVHSPPQPSLPHVPAGHEGTHGPHSAMGAARRYWNHALDTRCPLALVAWSRIDVPAVSGPSSGPPVNFASPLPKSKRQGSETSAPPTSNSSVVAAEATENSTHQSPW